MYIPEFLIPLHREDLSQPGEGGHYYVRYFYLAKDLQKQLEEAKSAFHEEGPNFIVEHFPTFYSFCQHFKQTTELNRERAWMIISKSFVELVTQLSAMLEDVKNTEAEVKNDMRNVTKMTCYILIEMMSMFQDKSTDTSEVCIDPKAKRKGRTADEDNWIENKLKMLNEIHSLLYLPIKFLWDPPVVDEEFVNLIGNFCYKCLEDSNISNPNLKSTRETIFQIFGLLIKNYLHGLTFCLKIVQLIKTCEHVVNPLAKGVVQLVNECKCNNIVKEIVREITEADGDQLAADASGTRSLNLFLVQLAEAIPETIIPAIDLLVNHLSGDSYTMRMCVLEVLGEIVMATLTQENLDLSLKKMRDEYLDCMEDHIHDVNAFVRSKCLQVWQKLCAANSIPISRLNRLLELTIGRLNDKSTNVKKQAIHLIKDLLERNPYSAQLSVTEIQNQITMEVGKLEALKRRHKGIDIRDAGLEWKGLEKIVVDLVEALEGEQKEETSEKDVEDVDLEKKIEEIGDCLLSGDYETGVRELFRLKERCNAALRLEEDDITLTAILQKIFEERVKRIVLSLPIEVQEELNKVKVTIEYLENALRFAELIDQALPIILTLLDSSVVTDVLESVHFFTAAYLFGFQQALEGVRKMLYLMYTKEDGIKAAVSDAYQNIYFDKKVQGRHQFVSTIKNLSKLIVKLNESQLNALELVVRKWLSSGLINNYFIQVMFERFSKKVQSVSDEDSWAALVLIRMVGAEEPRIIKSNISVFLSQSLTNPETQSFLLSKETCRALRHLLPERQAGKPVDETTRYSGDHEIFVALHKFLRDSLWRTRDPYYTPFAEEAINLVFHLCEKPDVFCERLIAEIHEALVGEVDPLRVKGGRPTGKTLTRCKDIDEHLGEENEIKSEVATVVKEEELSEESVFERDIALLTRFIAVVGQVAANYVMFLEGPVLNEFKRRNQLDFERKMKRMKEKKSKIERGRRLNKSGSAERLNKSEQDPGQEDLDFNRVAADDMDAEEMRKQTEDGLVTGTGYFSRFAPLILTICKNPGRYSDPSLQNSSLIALSKLMYASTAFCEDNLQLLVTICEKSHCPLRRKNAIIALGALQYRFPNTLEPWTPHMYGILRDPDPMVRLSAVTVLTDLIVNEMIKVRSNISDLAMCIIDKDSTIARSVRHFFREYSLKGNSLFNVLPCLISHLTRPDSELTEDEFKTIMRFVLGLFTKEKQSEYLIDKLFQYFDSATTERQWKDLAFCLSLLNYSDKALRKILENLRCFGNKLYLGDVYEAFCLIVSNAQKNPHKDKNVLKEISDLMKECREKIGTEDSGEKCPPPVSTNKRSVGKASLMNGRRPEASSARRQLVRMKVGESEEDADEEDAFLSDLSVRKQLRRRGVASARKASMKENLLSGDDDESGECPRKQMKSVRSRLNGKRSKAKIKYSDDTSEEEEKTERVLRSNRKRK